MADPERQRDLVWLHTVRGIAYHVSKIGDLIGKCAEDTEKLIREPHQPEQYPPKVPEPSHPPPRDVDEITVTRRQPQWTKREEPFSRYPFSRGSRPTPPPSQSAYYYGPEYGHMPLPRTYLHPEHDLDEHDVDRFRRKRRASAPSSDLDSYPHRMGIDGAMPRPKRVRINWSHDENKVFFDTVKNNDTLDEQSLIRAIVATMGGKRNWTQCKGHFRNLVYVNKIILDEKTKHWSVNPEAKRPVRAGPATPLRDSEQSGSEGEAQPGDKVENGKSQPLKGAPMDEEEVDKDEDEDELEVEDVELGGAENEDDGEYVAQDEREDFERAEEEKQEQSEPTDATKKTKLNGDLGMKNGTIAVEQARTRVLKGTRAEDKLGDKSPRAQNGERDGDDGNRTMPHRKQLSSAKTENGTKPYSTPPRKVRETKRRNTADYRPAGYAEGRRYLKQ